ARELAEEMLSLAQCVHDPTGLRDAHIMLGHVLLFCGELDAARAYLEQGLALDISQQPRSVSPLGPIHREMFGLFRLAYTLWCLGYPDQALQRSQVALTLARELAYPFSLALALIYAARLHYSRREAHLTYEYAEAALVLAREQGFAGWLAEATMLQGWALVEQEQGEAGITQIRQGLAAYRATGAGRSGFYLALLVEASKSVEQGEEGLQVITQGLAIMHSSKPGPLMAELYRLKGELLLTRSSQHQAEAETGFRQALAIACRQQAKSLELRAAMSLACLWQQQGKHAEAYELLAPIYGWFTEGFDTADLRDAQALLAALEKG